MGCVMLGRDASHRFRFERQALPSLLARFRPSAHAGLSRVGSLKPISVRVDTHEPYSYAFVEHTEKYVKLIERLAEVCCGLKRSGTESSAAFAVFYSPEDQVPSYARHGRIGCLVPAGSHAPPPRQIDTIPVRRVWVAGAGRLSARIQPRLAGSERCRYRGRTTACPRMELYEAFGRPRHQGNQTVEVTHS